MKLLIVATHFPPYSSVAVVRIASLTRFLIKQGYEITVLTNKHEFNSEEANVDSLLNEVNKVEIDVSQANGKFFECRDLYIKEFHKLMKVNQFDCVFITSGLFYTLPLCKISKVNYNTKCIIDFRDLWVFDIRSIKEFINPSNLLRKFVFFPIERQAIKYADKVITVTDGWSEILKKVHSKYNRKICVVYNGYDEEYLNKSISDEKNEKNLVEIDSKKFNIMSFGKLSYYSKHYSSVFFTAIKRLDREYPLIRVIQIGSEEKETNEVLLKTGFNRDKYINTGFCDYREGMVLLAKADVCVLIDIRKKAIGTKLYDYIFTNKPIIYVGKRNTYLSNFVASFEYGYSCQTEEQVMCALKNIIEQKIEKLSTNNSVKKYSRQMQNKAFLRIIESVVRGE